MVLLEGRGGDSREKSNASRDRVAVPADQRRATQKLDDGGKNSSSSPSPSPLPAAAGSKENRLLLAEGGAEEDCNPREGRKITATVQENEKEQERQEKESGKAEEERALSSPLVKSHVDGRTATGSAMTTTAAALPPLEASIMHAKLEGTASREKRQKQETRLAKKAPPVDPPEDADLARRRGGLGG